MDHPEQDITDRTPIWDSMHGLLMDTDVTHSYDFIASRCAESKYSIEELEQILFNEVLPAFKFNTVASPAPDWAGYETDWVVKRVCQKHRYGKKKPWLLHRDTVSYWQVIKPMIERIRSEHQTASKRL